VSISAIPRACPSLCVIGDALLDVDWDGTVHRVCNDAPAPILDTPDERARPGGAALAAALAARSGARVALVTALGGDREGRRLADLLAGAGVEVVDLGLDAPTPVKLRLRAGGQSIARVDRACSPVVPPGPWTAAAASCAARAGGVLVSDYGRGIAALPEVGALASARPGRVVWDPHPRGPRPPAGAALVTPNVAEAHGLAGGGGPPPARLPDVLALADRLAADLGCPVAVTGGALGAVVAAPGSAPILVPTEPAGGDPCGAGDRFAASVALGLALGEGPADAVARAVGDARAFVAGDSPGGGSPAGLDRGDEPAGPAGPAGRVIALPGPGGTGGPGPGASSVVAVASTIREAGGVVVAAGGCFDVLHTGHVRLLEQARALGDHLVVCLNGDASVRRLKGPGRPLNGAADRAAVLRSLACVDGVVVFDEDTPARLLGWLRPDVFVKGGDYQGVAIEEQAVLSRWGGQVVLLPLVPGRSTSSLIAAAAAGPAGGG
jgi:D-beta-D-heptose 7-phosphate kinase / D-beta-D-heptose 1-phosphate adenosyltransferase